MARGPYVGGYPSESREGVIYHVRRTEAGELACSCPGFYRWGHCWHVDEQSAGREQAGTVSEAQEALALAPAPPSGGEVQTVIPDGDPLA